MPFCHTHVDVKLIFSRENIRFSAKRKSVKFDTTFFANKIELLISLLMYLAASSSTTPSTVLMLGYFKKKIFSCWILFFRLYCNRLCTYLFHHRQLKRQREKRHIAIIPAFSFLFSDWMLSSYIKFFSCSCFKTSFLPLSFYISALASFHICTERYTNTSNLVDINIFYVTYVMFALIFPRRPSSM